MARLDQLTIPIRWVVCCFVGCVCWNLNAAAQYEYAVSGKIATEYGPGIGSGRTSPVYDFDVEVKGKKWYMKLVPDGTIQPTEAVRPQDEYSFPDSVEASSDGSFFYTVNNTSSQKAKHPKVANRGEAGRGIGSVPYAGDPSEIMVLWYAYASHHYFQSVTGLSIYPIRAIATGAELPPYPRSGRWTLSQEPPFLPSTITVFENRRGLGTNGAMPDLFTNSVFTATGITNISGMTLPSRVEVSYYYCWPASVSSPPRLHSRTKVVVTRFSSKVSDEVSFIPELPGPSVVHDFRHLTNSSPRTVSVMATQWPSDAQVLRRYNEVVGIEHRRQPTDVKKKGYVRYVLSVLILVPLAWFCISASRK